MFFGVIQAMRADGQQRLALYINREGRALRRLCKCSSFLCEACFLYAARTCEAKDSNKSGGDNL